MVDAQRTKPSDRSKEAFERQLREVNEALLVSSVRQHELTEQAQAAEAALRESERRFREVIELLPAAVYTTDAEGRITHFNSAAVELVGRVPQLGQDQWCVSWKLFRPDGTPLPHDECPMAIALKEGRAIRGAEVILERPDGTRVWVAPYPTPIKDSRGKLVGGINMVMDITERTLLEKKAREHAEELAEVDRRKDEFLAMLSHELRNPLASILNVSQLLRLFGRDRSSLEIEAHEMLDRQAAQLTRLVDDLLDVSRIATGHIHLQEGHVDLGGVVLRAIESVRPQAAKKEQAVEQSLPDVPVWVNGDSVRLGQIVINLLNNAIKYTHRGGHVSVSLHAEGEEVILRVRDDGIGIAPEVLPRVFDLFTQAEHSIDRSQGGLGIGLALVRSLVGLHGGKVDVQSTPGKGSEFTVRFPMSLPAQVAPNLAEGATTPVHPLTILVVDDNIDAAKSMAMLLSQAGHTPRVAYDAAAAMQAALECVPAVMLLDIGLPVVNGYQLAEQIRRQPALRDVTLVAVTGYGQAADKQRSTKAGFDHHLVKPVSFERIESILSAAVRTHGSTDVRGEVGPY